MKLLLLVIFLTAAVLGTEDTSEKIINPDLSESRDPRIVGGEDAYIQDIPYQVSLRYCSPITGLCGHFCGGSIISPNTILTAAHCVNRDDPQTLSIRAGSDLKSQGGQIIPVRAIVVHPDYESRGLYNDVAVLKLRRNLVFGSKVMPIGLPPKGYRIRAGTDLLVSGWGALKWQGSGPERLQKVFVPYVPNDVCAEIYNNIRPGSICAGIVGKDACQGDSGGPLVHRNFVVGIVSGGDYCGYEGYPGTYARTSEYLGFIAWAMSK